MKIAGALLRLERLRQNKGQKEVCYGICVPSYLSKIEHGTVNPDDTIVKQLFAKMNITYCCNESVLRELRIKIESYFKCLNYAYKTKEIYQELLQQKENLEYSELVIDWLLIKGFEWEDVIDELANLEEYMTSSQKAYFYLLCFDKEPGAKEAENWCTFAAQTLNNSFSYANLLECYFLKDNYTAIHQFENRITAIALEEGNTYYLANYYFVKGSAYASLNMDDMMMSCYEKSVNFLHNTGWTEELSAFYYNIGATYISLKKYDEAISYLKKTGESALTYHKLGLAYIRKGKIEKGKEYLEKMKQRIENECPENETEILRYKEACMECESDFLDSQEYMDVLEKLLYCLKKNYSFGHLYFYKELIMEVYKRQRKYKKALEFEEEISSKIRKTYI